MIDREKTHGENFLQPDNPESCGIVPFLTGRLEGMVRLALAVYDFDAPGRWLIREKYFGGGPSVFEKSRVAVLIEGFFAFPKTVSEENVSVLNITQ